jgi:hypothetical protein
MEALRFQLEVGTGVIGEDLSLKDAALRALEKLGHIGHVDNAELALRDVNGLVTLLLQLDEVTAADDESQEWVDNLLGFIHNFDV